MKGSAPHFSLSKYTFLAYTPIHKSHSFGTYLPTSIDGAQKGAKKLPRLLSERKAG